MTDSTETDIVESERKAFEEWFHADSMPLEHSNWFRRDADGYYEIDFVEHSWNGWEARAERARAELSETQAELDAFGKVSPQQYEKDLAKLRAERDAAARDMRERAVALVEQLYWKIERIHPMQIRHALQDLPTSVAVIATESGGAT